MVIWFFNIVLLNSLNDLSEGDHVMDVSAFFTGE